MATTRKRLTLDIDEALQRRLKSAAALKGISMREFCESALEEAVDRKQHQQVAERESRLRDFDEFIARNREITGGRKFPGNSADIIREERELRAEQIDNRI